jgi:hypothetical protein
MAAPSGGKIRTLRDVPPFEEVWRLAVQSEVVRAGRERALTGPRAQFTDAVVAGEADVEAALELWLEAFQAAVIDEEIDADVALEADRVTKAVLCALYDADGSVTLAEFEQALDDVAPDWVEDDERDVFLIAGTSLTTELLRRLGQCGAITFRVTAADGSDGADELTDAARRPGQVDFTLTPLGVYGCHEYLLGTGCEAPVEAR